jgi:hypothetical protein
LDPVGKLFGDFRDQIRDILEFGLKNREHLSSIDGHAASPWYQSERTRFIVQALGDNGDSDTVRVLEPLADAEDLGSEALKAIRKLKGFHS